MLESIVRCVSKKYNFVNMSNGSSDLYSHSTYGGEDAWFITQNCIGVADGVSGWITKGVSSAFSNSLMLECKSNCNYSNDPKKILEKAYENTKCNVVGGSSTALIAKLNSNKLIVANHGDSCLIVIRDKKIIYKTLIDQIDTDRPYQLGKWDLNEDNNDSNIHNAYVEKMYNEKGRRIDDTKVYEFDVTNGDIVITATDGFFDNIIDDEIIQLFEKYYDESNLVELLSNLMKKAICNVVLKNDPESIDDITVIVSKIII